MGLRKWHHARLPTRGADRQCPCEELQRHVQLECLGRTGSWSWTKPARRLKNGEPSTTKGLAGLARSVSAILKIAMGQPRNEKPARRTLSHLSGRARRLEKYVWKNAWNALIQYNRLSQVHGIPAET